MNNKKRVNFNLSIDLYNFLKQYSEERGITFTTAVDRFLSRSIEQYQMGTVQVVKEEVPLKEEAPFKEDTPLKEETTTSSFNGFAHLEDENDHAIMEMFLDMPD